ncbi:hypothetical protein [Sphingobium aquiterrae]|uniref:hypothetical protein n=1 Tax=Sphingobium aquiterrae TaxID=2038656 RepID=UPI00301A1F1A
MKTRLLSAPLPFGRLQQRPVGHPFRHALSVKGVATPARAEPADDDKDWKLFVLSFAAFFTAFYSFIG